MAPTWQVVAALLVFAGAYVAIATEVVPRVKAALVGAGLMLAVGATDGDTAFFSRDSGVDWNVVFLLLGMMIVVGVVKQTGLFEYLAVWAAKRARGRPYRVLVLLCVITATASAALDNVTTVLLVAPVTLLVCDRIGVRPEGFLIAEAMASNIGGTATLIGDPPNIIIASRGDLSFNDFLVNLAPFIAFLLAVFVLLARWLFRSSFRYDPERAAAVLELDERRAIRDPRLLRRSLAVVALILVFFSLHTALHVEPSVVALLGAGVLVLVSGVGSDDYLDDVEWETLVFFAGLFVMVGALVDVGVIEYLAERAVEATDGRFLLASTALLFGSAVTSGVVDNIPFVATMSPLVADLVRSGDGSVAATSLWWALALGADLGGNATAIGASANVVVTGIAARNDHPISFWHFTRYGLVVTAVTVGLSWPYLWVRYFVLG